ncbi:MAG: MFS transporter [Asgard group archaeon]|nr:MFS transporter [Asgard group archaeon]
MCNLTDTISDNIDSSLPIRKRNEWFHFERNEILLLVSYFLFGISFANYEPYAPIWLNQIFQEDSFLIIGFVVVIPSIIGAIGSPFWGLLADKFGVKKFVITGMFAFSSMFVSLIFIESSTYFLVIILFGYLIGSAQTSNLFVLATKSTTKPKEIIFAKFTMTVSLAFVIFSPLAGWFYDNFLNSMIIQLSMATASCFIATIIIFFVKEKSEVIEVKDEINIQKEKKALSNVPFIFIGLMLLTFLFQSGSGFWPFSSIYFLDTMNVKGVYFSIFIILKTALAVPLSFLLGRVKRKRIMGIILACFTGYFVLVNVLMTIFLTQWILVLIINGIPMYPIYNVFLYGLTASFSNKERRATAFGIFNALGTFGYITGIVIVGAIADHWLTGKYSGIFSMFPMSIILTGFAFLTALFFYFTVLRKSENEEKISSVE